MRGTEAVAALAEFMPVAHGVDERVDWGEVEAAWETRFPSDYVHFMEVYGSGVISDGISILLPSLQVEGYPYAAGPGLEDETGIARELWEMCRDEADFDVDLESIVAWGVTSGADIYCWVTTNEDPDRWPVLTYVRYTDEMQLHPFGMADFLRKVLGDVAFRQGKISVALDEASFVNWRNA
ncbi:SMI1/KNR4 family protein [Streptomyces sp. NBC_00190]|uniref:SMI1/KNR4 family protein n=1 Tax=unclassified Streptomyces TaxID=2593676 RepID=UPI002E2B28F6|nr:SMI1/KNR4 family protein [Streptomyces sp. NBC_00190]WSZ37613.1 SMI1/KNR4 family protein [Streptomyces sp. NBC_00868]